MGNMWGGGNSLTISKKESLQELRPYHGREMAQWAGTEAGFAPPLKRQAAVAKTNHSRRGATCGTLNLPFGKGGKKKRYSEGSKTRGGGGPRRARKCTSYLLIPEMRPKKKKGSKEGGHFTGERGAPQIANGILKGRYAWAELKGATLLYWKNIAAVVGKKTTQKSYCPQ